MQIAAIRATRRYLGDRLFRTAPPHRLLDPASGPLIAVRLHILTRKTLGRPANGPRQSCACGRGPTRPRTLCRRRSGGIRRRWCPRYAALEGTFLGGCIFSGRAAGRAAAAAVL
jgi:predicted oxidoreductase